MRIILLTLITILFTVFSCSDNLDLENPNGFTKSVFYKNEGDAIQATNAAYSSLQKEGLYGWYYTMVADLLSDDTDYTAFAAGSEEGLIPTVNFSGASDTEVNRRMFRDIYNGIFRANVVLNRVGAMDESVFKDGIKNRCLGEAYFLRALYHFHAVMLWGGQIPLVLKEPEETADFYTPPAGSEKIWAQLTADLMAAKSLLPTKGSSKTEIGRANLGAATAFLGKVYLYRATMDLSADAAEMYQKAADELSLVVGQSVGEYGLVDNYRDNHTNANEYNQESIFEIPFTFTAATAGQDFYFYYFISTDDPNRTTEARHRVQNAGIHRSVANRWWNIRPSDKMLAEYERDNQDRIIDPRCYMTIWAPGGAYFIDQVKDGSGSVLRIDTLYYDDIQWEGNIGWRKYEYDFDIQDVTPFDRGTPDDINQRVIRYADVLLMLAESIAKGASAPYTAEGLIDQVRNRANNQIAEQEHLWYATGYEGATRSPLPNVSTLIAQKGWTLMQAIQHERMVEFAAECNRWHDIVRWQIGSETVANGQDGGNFNGADDYHLSIPITEIATNPGYNNE